jgi:MSHA biogenesis protein MshJ
MMNWRLANWEWFNQLPPLRRQWYIFFSGITCIFLVWWIFLLSPVVHEKKDILEKTQALLVQQDALVQQMNNIISAVTDNKFSSAMQEERKLTARMDKVQQRLAKASPILAVPGDLLKLKNAIINQKNNIKLVNISDSRAAAWAPETVDKTDLEEITYHDFYRHDLTFEFQGSYFDVIKYLEQLEKLPLPVYWDNLEYKVVEYPKADVQVKVHFFEQKD